MEARLSALEDRLANVERRLADEPTGGAGDELIASRRTGGSDAQVLKKVSTRLQDFEAQITAQLSNMQSDFDKKLSHVNRGASSTTSLDAAGPSAGLDTMAEDLDHMKYDVGELKDLLSNNKGEVNHIRRIVLACERDMEDFIAAMDAVKVDLDEMRARVDATHSIITSRQRVEATMTAEISTMRLDIGDIQEALKNHDFWMEHVSRTLQQMQDKEEHVRDMVAVGEAMETAQPGVHWEYLDPRGVIQGPFSSSQMRTWDEHGYFPADLHVRPRRFGRFRPTHEWHVCADCERWAWQGWWARRSGDWYSGSCWGVY